MWNLPGEGCNVIVIKAMECLSDRLVEEVFECERTGKRTVRCESTCHGWPVEDKLSKGGDSACSCLMDHLRALKNQTSLPVRAGLC